jgi:predicted O-methyltransferase YrrM
MDMPNWFVNDGQKNFALNLGPFTQQPTRMLQVGAYTGDASIWLVENIMKHPESVLIDVDTWEGSDEPSHHGMDWGTVEQVYDMKTYQARQERKVIKFKGTSDNFFKSNQEMYDFIYIDGDHTAYGVIKDAVSAYECLNVGGIIAFDDYQWSASLGITKEPRLAIDAFTQIYSDRVAMIVDGYQRWFRKMR